MDADISCKKIQKLVLPAIRVAIAEELSKKYDYTQEEIAKKLGVVQVAVSKYLNGRYSKEIEKIADYIKSKGLANNIVLNIVNKESKEKIENEIMALCENKELLSIA
jgi:predicted transcriptional regulator